MADIKRYSTTLVILHWTLAIFILGALFMGAFVLDEMASDHPQKILFLKLHIILGIGTCYLPCCAFTCVIALHSQLR